jgi:hypothetical protein
VKIDCRIREPDSKVNLKKTKIKRMCWPGLTLIQMMASRSQDGK